MSQVISGINTRAELELFLVSKHAKPAALITLDAFIAWVDEDRTARQFSGFSTLSQSLSLSEDMLRAFEMYFPHLSVQYQRRGRSSYPVVGQHACQYAVDTATYYVGKDNASLSTLVCALEKMMIMR